MSGPIAVVVLAGGQGNRIGGHKPQRMLAGERLIDRAVRQSRRWSDLVSAKLGHGSFSLQKSLAD